MTGKKDGVLFCVFFVVSFAVYFLSLKNYFINDDFIHLDFVKNFQGNYLDFLFPHVRPSDVVTHARYEPFHIYFYAFLYPFFRDSFPAYQLLHIAIHALNAFLIYKIGTRLNIRAAGAFIAALFFCVYRLNSQEVLWYASLFCTAAYSLLLAAFLLFLKPSRASQFYSVGLFLVAALLSLRAPQYVLLTGAWLWVFRKELKEQELLGRKLKTYLAYAGVSAFSVICNLISWRHFPNDIPGFEFDFFALWAFFLNLVFPYQSGTLLKTAVLFLCCGFVVVHRKDKAVIFLTLAIILNAFFWFLIFSAGHLPYAPRYSYIAAAFFSLLLGHFLSGAIQSGVTAKKLIAAALAVCLIGFNAYLVVSQDIVWFKYLSVRGKKLAAISRFEAPGKKQVFIADDFFSHDPNLNYFKDELEFVSEMPAVNSGVFPVDLERDRYAEYFGPDIGRQYWFYPWFVRKVCKDNTPWC